MMTYGLDFDGKEHPQKVMQALGITYQHAVPQSIADQWWFLNCEQIPNDLPRYLTPFLLKPFEAIGWGLNREWAEKVAAHPNRAA